MTTPTVRNSWLEGNHAPLREERTVLDLPTAGTIPEHLDGRYVRNGPNPIDPDPATYDWFIGDSGMVHGVRLRGGRAEWYRNRWVRCRSVCDALGEPWPEGPVHAVDFGGSINVVGHAGRTFALMEGAALPYELTDTLDTVGSCDFEGTLPGGYAPHPHRDPDTGELHAVSYIGAWGLQLMYSVLGVDGRIRHTAYVPVDELPMIHDFSLTERHVVVYDLPVVFDLAKAAAGGLPLSWKPEHPARVGVFGRDGDGSDVRWFDVEPCCVYHGLNAYDDGGSVVVDVVRHPEMYLSDGRANGRNPTLDRWTIDLASGRVREQRLSDRPQEFPRIDERRTGRPHRFGYTIDRGQDRAGRFGFTSAGLLKHDLATGAVDVCDFGPRRAADEFVFVPNGEDAAEGDGVLMGFVYDAESDRSDLVLLDAATLDTVAEVHLPVRVPHGIHGNWIPTSP